MSNRTIILISVSFIIVIILAIYAYNSFLYMYFIDAEPVTKDLKLEIVHLAGSEEGIAGFADDNGKQAQMAKPIRLAPLNDTTVVFADINNHAIRTIDIHGQVKTLAGGPEKQGFKDGPADQAMFDSPHGVAVRSDGVIAVAEANNNTIRLLTPIQTLVASLAYYEVSTLAGVANNGGLKDGANENALFDAPHAVAWGSEGELYVADIGNSVIRMIKEGQTTTVAGTGKSGNKDGGRDMGQLSYPMDLAMDSSESLWIIDAMTLTLRKWLQDEGLTTPFPDLEIAMPHGITIDNKDNIIVAEMYGNRIIRYEKVTGEPTIICGDIEEGHDSSHLRKPAAVLVHGGYIWIADLGNNRIAVVSYKQ